MPGCPPPARSVRSSLLLLALGFTAACSSTSPTTTTNKPPPTPTSNDISIVVGAQSKGSGAFDPNPKTVSLAGGASVSVRWVNGDISGGDYQTGNAVTHRIASDDSKFATSGNLGGNATYTINLTTAGTYAFHCEIHPTMVGSITVNP